MVLKNQCLAVGFIRISFHGLNAPFNLFDVITFINAHRDVCEAREQSGLRVTPLVFLGFGVGAFRQALNADIYVALPPLLRSALQSCVGRPFRRI